MSTERSYRGGTAELLLPTPDSDQVGASTLGVAPSRDSDEEMPLLSDERAAGYRNRWEECQRAFVDEPQQSVQDADQLVADLIRDLAQEFSTARTQLEEQWSRGEEVSTDDLRYGFQRYRSFFNRLLSV